MKRKINIIIYNVKHPIVYLINVFRGMWAIVCYKLRMVGILRTYKSLEQFKGIHTGKRCFLIGTGPSLTIHDVNLLANEITFAVNSLVNSFDQLIYTPTYYGLADKRAVKLFYPKAAEISVDAIFVGAGRLAKREVMSSNTFRFPDERYYSMYKAHSLLSNEYELRVSHDITKMVFDGGTVLYCMMQIAMYMGIKEIYLIGVDCNYESGILNFNEFRTEEEIKRGGNEVTMINGFKKMKEYADQKGVKIYNATRGGKLEIFPRVDIDAIF